MASQTGTSEAFLELVGSIYDAALDPAQWRVALPVLARAVGAERGVVGFIQPTRGRSAVSLWHEIDDETVRLWREEFACYDPWYDRRGITAAGTIIVGGAVVPWDDLRSTEVHRAVLQPAGIDDILTAVVTNHERGHDFVSVHRSRRRGTFDQREARLFRALSPHLLRAAQIYERLSHLSELQGAHEELLDMLPFGVILLDVGGVPIAVNREGERILNAGDGFFSRGGALRAVSADANGALGAAIAGACATARGESAVGGALVAVPRPSFARPYQVLVAPVRERLQEQMFGSVRIAAVAVVSDPEASPEPAAATLAPAFGLTPALARLAAVLASGRTLADYAEECAITTNTARWQLKELFARTGTNRQAELVRLLLTGVAQLRFRTPQT